MQISLHKNVESGILEPHINFYSYTLILFARKELLFLLPKICFVTENSNKKKLAFRCSTNFVLFFIANYNRGKHYIYMN